MSQPQLLLQKARENLEAAELLLQKGHIDIAASRAYYPMFYVAEALLSTKGLSFSSHSAVIAAFGKEFAKTGLIAPEHHWHLKDAFETRQIGDYGADIRVTMNIAEEVLIWARDFSIAGEAYLKRE